MIHWILEQPPLSTPPNDCFLRTLSFIIIWECVSKTKNYINTSKVADQTKVLLKYREMMISIINILQ